MRLCKIGQDHKEPTCFVTLVTDGLHFRLEIDDILTQVLGVGFADKVGQLGTKTLDIGLQIGQRSLRTHDRYSTMREDP